MSSDQKPMLFEEKSDTVDTGAGNTKPPQKTRSRSYIFTWNTPDTDERGLMDLLESWGVNKYVFQLEKGEEKGRLHYQGVVYFENARSFMEVKKMCAAMHWEATRCWKSAIEYCSKDDTREKGPWTKGVILKEKIELCEPSGWQEELVKICLGPIDKRKVIWFYDPRGQRGKSEIVKYLVVKHNALFVEGQGKYVKYAVMEFGNPKIILYDLPRSFNKDYICWSTLENIKNGLIFNTHYKSKMCIFNSPHLVLFANELPDWSKLSADRWQVYEINDVGATPVSMPREDGLLVIR